MTVVNSNELPTSEYVKAGVFASRRDMEEFVARCEAESGISYVVTIYPARATDAVIPGDKSWSGGESFTVVASGTTA